MARRYGKIWLILAIFCLMPVLLSAKEIKPGVTITPENYQEYLPELKKLFDPATYKIKASCLERGSITIPVVERQEYPQSKDFHKYTEQYSGTCQVGPNNELIGWKAGLPFPNPKTGAELAWNVDRKGMDVDQYSFHGDFSLFSSKGKLERQYRWHLFSLYYTGRFLIPPIHEYPENNGKIRMKEAFIMLKPFDIKGFCFLRTRYEDISRWDDVYTYIPAIRRVRRLTGADVCDPMLGSDTIYDDFQLFRQKITSKMTFKMREKEMLVSSAWVFGKGRPAVKAGTFQTTWQIRPVYILEIFPNDPDYVYSKRVVFVEKQRKIGNGYGINTYDQKGRLCRSQITILGWSLPSFNSYGGYASYHNLFNMHSTVLDAHWTDPDHSLKPEHFSFKWLLKHAR